MIRCAFFFNDTATTEIYTLSLHDALPIWLPLGTSGNTTMTVKGFDGAGVAMTLTIAVDKDAVRDRKSTRLNSSHANISYAVFCLKKKKPHLISNNQTTAIQITAHHSHNST